MNGYTLSTGSRVINSSGMTGVTRDSRPPPSMRGFASLPAVANLPPMDLARLPGTLPAHVPSASEHKTTTSRSGNSGSRQGSSTSLSGMASVSGQPATTIATPPTEASADVAEQPLSVVIAGNYEVPASPPSDTISPGNEANAPPATMTMPGHELMTSNKRMSRGQQYAQNYRMSQSDWETHKPYHGHERMDRSRVAPVAHEDLVNVFPEQASEVPVVNKGKRLSKGGGKLVKKKHRWSLSKAPAVTV